MKRSWLILSMLVNVFTVVAYSQDDSFNAVEDKSELAPGENAEEKIRKNFFLRADVSKTDCYVGEPLMAEFKAYSRLDANSQVLKRPSLSGFSVIEMVDAYTNQPDVEKYNGENYYVHLIRKVQLFPLQSGTFVIEPAEVESVIHLRKAGGSKSLSRIRDFFRRRSNDASLNRQMIFKTPPVEIHVRPLPEKDQPEDFNGAVGDFLIQIQLGDSVISTREPVSVKVIVSGTGNFPLITEPKISWPASAEISTPTVQEQVNKYAYPLSGFKSYQFTIEHRDTGHFNIPPIKFFYFEPKSGKYKVAESNSLNYDVLPAGVNNGNENQHMVFSTEKQKPLHLYYFAAIASVIVALIIYFLVRPTKKNS